MIFVPISFPTDRPSSLNLYIEDLHVYLCQTVLRVLFSLDILIEVSVGDQHPAGIRVIEKLQRNWLPRFFQPTKDGGMACFRKQTTWKHKTATLKNVTAIRQVSISIINKAHSVIS